MVQGTLPSAALAAQGGMRALLAMQLGFTAAAPTPVLPDFRDTRTFDYLTDSDVPAGCVATETRVLGRKAGKAGHIEGQPGAAERVLLFSRLNAPAGWSWLFRQLHVHVNLAICQELCRPRRHRRC
jgi:hypothetical protein